MRLLGLHAGGHDSAAALVEDGALVFAIEEERLSRKKHDGAFPRRAVEACLAFAGIPIEGVDGVCLSFDPMEVLKEKLLRYTLESFPRANRLFEQELGTARRMVRLEEEIRETLDYRGEVTFHRHHRAHMASAYHVSGFPDSALFTIDGIGEIEVSATGEAEGARLSTYADGSLDFPHSIGLLYSAVTWYLGFLHHCDEGKVMGLAPYGRRETFRPLFEEIVRLLPEGRYELDLSYLAFPFDREAWLAPKFFEACGPPRAPKSELLPRHRDVAAALQEATERAMVHTATHLRKRSGRSRLCLAGGVALNCVANGRVLREAGFSELFVQPAAYDAGAAFGAALDRHFTLHPASPRRPMRHAYWGTGYTVEEIAARLAARGVVPERPADLLGEVADALAAGRIVGWFQGRMELGPRALGNRSILTAPFPASMKDVLNDRVKHREPFRPFAPVVLLENLSRYFDTEHPSPYMLLSVDVREEHRERLGAVTHVDGSARVQSVTGDENPALAALLRLFEERTGVGVLLNTSFNVMGQPIVETPEEALDCFLGTEMDLLVFESSLMIRKEAPAEAGASAAGAAEGAAPR